MITMTKHVFGTRGLSCTVEIKLEHIFSGIALPRFCDIQNNQDRGSVYQPEPSASADIPNRDLDHSGYITNTECYNCFIIH